MNLITNLYEHQLKAVNKLKKIKVNALFMEMGTGKTRTMLELIKIRLDKKRINKVIWLCPCSVKENLRRDIIKHTGMEQSDLITICGIETLSTSIKWNSYLLNLVEEYDCYLIVDESSKVKNPKAKRTMNIIRLAEKCKYKSILNGTPITRNEVDLYSQMYILDWRILGYKSFWSFAANHIEYDDNGRIRECLNTNYLVEKIAPYSYQVKKNECIDLPSKTYDTAYYDLTDEQHEHYIDIANSLLFSLDELKPYTIYRFLSALQMIISGYKVKMIECDEEKEFHLIKERFFKNTKSNPRIECLLNLVDNINDKTIIFCKYTDEINIIVKLLKEKYGEDSAVSYNGELNLKQRQHNLDLFKEKAKFLVANKSCAGYGLNLQFCSYIIFYSNDFDYGTRAQAEDRVHRIGQNKNVHIIDICSSYTLDERIIKCLNKKESLLECFKAELEETKDTETIINFVTKKYGKKSYTKKIFDINKGDLKEC